MMRIRQEEIVYLDHNATTRVAPEVFEAMVPWLTEFYGNPSSAYGFGAQVAEAMLHAREQVAALLGCAPKELVFTSCGTESDNTALLAAIRASGKRHVITTRVEHSALINQAESLEATGHPVTYLPVAPDGTLDVKSVEKAIRSDTAVVSVMWANNETGVLFPVEEIAALCKSRKILFHTDAVQCPGKIPLRLSDTDIQLLSLSGHKFHAPKGVGVLYIREGVRFTPFQIGGKQEGGRRGGTENVASIIGMGRAAELALEHLSEEQTRVRALRDKLEAGILAAVPLCRVNGHRDLRLPNTTNISFDGVEAEALLHALDAKGICVSSGSACTTGSIEPSHVLTAMGVSPEQAQGAIRFSLGRENTEAEIEKTLSLLPPILEKLREASPRWRHASAAVTA